ncbi:hypothetical protein CYLTODRAFT_486941 [Cylindrobasidium torrendii FP15055 ss-10]|uniref:Uncharacterized protein n=1 Tax=Cylindrobasidium torrendii FP15055 ss-10 TaxID=1314674 RepID=A0A0D7BNR8_9AGAR|nr:hypothetical protein CYLTODRAFT_486941 [Cylindrobasidium torrendii FP15055 ss-10]
MFGFGRTTRPAHSHTTTTHTKRHSRWHRKNPDRVAAGYKASLSNPNTTSTGRKHAKHELHKMGRSAHVPFSVKVKRALGIRSSPRTTHAHTTQRHY